MDPRLQEMLDFHEIRMLLGEYCRGVDRMDQARMASVYAARSWDDHGMFRGSGQAFAEHVTQLMKAGASKMESHLLGQTLIRVDADEAGAETYFIATIRCPAKEQGGELLVQLGGRYVDELVREQGRWKIKNRTCVHDWSTAVPIVRDWLADVDFVRGKRSNEDPSFAVLGCEHSGVPGETS